ncbi:hypothetical protein RDI58_003431 [Solanum bulbocastanum]|uniref:Leucine-rich repeat-containing N-terminal plant-type domain-containing protein n=1 Tax=Solanum bulbocastanum TaxID=147425 RepID=A0AAN8UHH4_SOLBU
MKVNQNTFFLPYTSTSLAAFLVTKTASLVVGLPLPLSSYMDALVVLEDPLSILDNWDYNDATPCLWTGVTCAPDMFRVISLVLPNSKLIGSIPEELGFIQHLHTIDLSNNFLNGTLPVSLLNASELPSGFQFVEVLDLSSNLLNGALPDNFDGDSLKYLNFSSNKLSGLVSPQFAKKIPANAAIDLSLNCLTGNKDLCGKPLKKLCTIPSTLSSPPNLTTNPPAIAAIPKEINSTPLPEQKTVVGKVNLKIQLFFYLNKKKKKKGKFIPKQVKQQ